MLDPLPFIWKVEALLYKHFQHEARYVAAEGSVVAHELVLLGITTVRKRK